MNKFFLLSLVLSTLVFSRVSAQESTVVCGTSGVAAQELADRLFENRAAQIAVPRSIQYVPVKFHLVAKNDGSGRIDEVKLLDELCFLNQVFAVNDIQLYIKDGFSYIDNTAVFSNPKDTENTIMAIRRDREAMNIFIVGDADIDDNTNGTVLGYYSIPNDLIVINKNQFGGSSKALAHEIGHFFSLLHTHNGWDTEAWSNDIGNPSPTIAPDGVPTEKMDGSNCDNAGDYVCDTPPDYNGLGWPDCDYRKGARDPDSVLIDPQETNIMSYFLNGCLPSDFYFSDEQKRLIRSDLASSRRNYLRSNAFSPTAIQEPPVLVAPLNDGEAPGGSGKVRLEWTAIDGATDYIIEVDRVPSFSITPSRMIVSDNFVEMEGLDIGKKYFWRVRPFNPSVSCSDLTSAIQSFTVGAGSTAVNDIDFLNGWSISPNPLSRSQELQLVLESTRAFEGEINLVSITGQVTRRLGSRRFNSGINRLSIPVNDLSPGVYLLSLATTEGRLNQRIVVME